jgi:hypothetical protein
MYFRSYLMANRRTSSHCSSVIAVKYGSATSMNETAVKNNQQVFFDLKALRRELEEMAVKTKKPDNSERRERQEVQGPVLVIRGR